MYNYKRYGYIPIVCKLYTGTPHKKMSDTQPYKNYFGITLAEKLAASLVAVQPAFPAGPFIAQVAAQVEALELKGRVALIAAALRAHLPPDYPEALKILLAILGPANPSEQGMFTLGYHLMPVAYFVEAYGTDYFDESLAALYEITQRHTAEYAIRPFLMRYPQQTLALLQQWTQDQSPHVRRLVSEGSRPRLPWAARLPAFIADPSPVLNLLEPLKADPSAYVRKSVANNLNDILKDQPGLGLAMLTRWSQGASEETRWIIGHALRNLVKQGHPEALRLLGFHRPQVTLQKLEARPEIVRMGDTLTFSFALQNEAPEPQNLVIDYIIHFVRSKGEQRPKVFKLTTLTLPPGEQMQVQKRHSFKPVTTRRYYAGRHRLEIQLNGVIAGGVEFELG